MQPKQVYQLVTETFAELGATDPQTVHRSLLLLRGYFAGQRFRCGDFEAMLPADHSRIEFRGPDGNLLRTINLAEPARQEAA